MLWYAADSREGFSAARDRNSAPFPAPAVSENRCRPGLRTPPPKKECCPEFYRSRFSSLLCSSDFLPRVADNAVPPGHKHPWLRAERAMIMPALSGRKSLKSSCFDENHFAIAYE